MKLVARALGRAELARAAEAQGAAKVRRRLLDGLRRDVRRLRGKLERPRGFPSALPPVLRPIAETIALGVDGLRAEPTSVAP